MSELTEHQWGRAEKLRPATKIARRQIVTEDDVRSMVYDRAARVAGGGRRSGLANWCAEHRVNRHHANEFLNGKRRPCSDLLAALNLEYRICRRRLSA